MKHEWNMSYVYTFSSLFGRSVATKSVLIDKTRQDLSRKFV